MTPIEDVFTRLAYQGFQVDTDGRGTWTVTDPWGLEQSLEHQSEDDLERWLNHHGDERDEATYCRLRARDRLVDKHGFNTEDATVRISQALQERKDQPGGLPTLVDFIIDEAGDA
jgi:hypothetical protein